MVGFLTISAEPTRGLQPRRSKIAVDGFGGIAKAEVQLAPLTILVGKNNSGKSYLASLLWAMHNFSSEISFGRGEGGIKAPKWFRDGLQECKGSGASRNFAVSGKQISRTLNTWLRSKKIP